MRIMHYLSKVYTIDSQLSYSNYPRIVIMWLKTKAKIKKMEAKNSMAPNNLETFQP